MHDHIKYSFDWILWFYWIMATTLGWILGRFLLPYLAPITIGIALGIMQSFVLQNRISNAWKWLIVTAAGWIIGAAIILSINQAIIGFFAGLISGFTTGIFQWLVLRRVVPWAGWWVIISMVGWSTGMGLLPGIFLTGVIAGVITGFALVLLLRFPKQIKPDRVSA